MLDCINVWGQRDLILYKAYADFRAEVERTYLGVLWWVLEPIINTAIYYFVFSKLLDIRGGMGTEFVPFLLIGIIMYSWFNVTVNRASTSILANKAMVSQVNFKKIIFPITTIITSSIGFAFAFAVLLVALWCMGYGITIHYAALPGLMLIQLLIITAVAIPTAAMVPLVQDLKNLITYVLHLLFFLSGILYNVDNLSEEVQRLFWFNPVAQIISAYRDVLMYHRWPHRPVLLLVALIALIITYFGARYIAKLDSQYAKRMA